MRRAISRKEDRGELRVRPTFPGNGKGMTYAEAKKQKGEQMARGEKPTINREQPSAPEFGTLKPEEIADAVLMEHPGKGKRFIPKESVKKKEKRGWVVVGKEPEPEPEPTKREAVLGKKKAKSKVE